MGTKQNEQAGIRFCDLVNHPLNSTTNSVSKRSLHVWSHHHLAEESDLLAPPQTHSPGSGLSPTRSPAFPEE